MSNYTQAKTQQDMSYILKMMLMYCFLVISIFSFSQDTIRLTKAPKVKLHGWYPNYHYIDEIKKGDTIIVMTLTPEFDSTKLRNCIIDLRTNNRKIIITSTIKKYPSQFIVEVNKTNKKNVRIEAWLLLEKNVVLIRRKDKWVNIKDVFPVKGNFVRIDKIKLKLI